MKSEQKLTLVIVVLAVCLIVQALRIEFSKPDKSQTRYIQSIDVREGEVTQTLVSTTPVDGFTKYEMSEVKP